MLIDWFTVGAQALNFVILAWLMKRFLFKPIRGAIEAREQQIAAKLADADAKQAEAHEERAEFQRKNEELDRQRAALLQQATDAAKVERQRLLDEARKAADALTAKRQKTLTDDARNLDRAIGLRTQREVFAVARKALADLAATGLEQRMVEVFTGRVRALSGKTKAELGDALKTAAEPALVHSAFNLPDEQRGAIQRALNETFSADIRLRFETAPELVSGIELTANGHKLAWSIAQYLTSLEQTVGELLNTQAKSEPAHDRRIDPKPSA